MPKQQPNHKPGEKPPAPLVKRKRQVASFSAMVEILKSGKPRSADEAETGSLTKPVPTRQAKPTGC
jgi:hypothetical protein